ncbi:adenylate kinase [Halobacteriales archaeon QH_10_65_19]|nr:MAG: adenylate kinase [Halobacteriales archaeon QH_10_65_19]
MTAPNILIMGPQGSGKGTQSSNIVEKYEVEHVTTGDALRANKDMDISDMDTEYDTPRAYMDAGDLVPDVVVDAIVEEALSEADGFVLDGYPRNSDQAQALDGMADLDAVISLSVSHEVSVKRLTGRRVCEDCGANYHVEFDQPDEEGVCEECGGSLIQRDDDTQAAVENRLDIFEEETQPVVDRYRGREEFVEVDGEQPPDAVWEDVEAALEERVDA